MATIKEITASLSNRFKPEAAGNLNAVFQFEIDQAHYFIAVHDGSCQVSEGEHASPHVTLTMSQATLEQLMSNELTGMQAFMTGKLKTQGDMMLATKLSPLFDLG